MPYPAGTCHHCGGVPEPERRNCAPCLKLRREQATVLRAKRRRQRLCLVCGCQAKPGRRYCAEHLAYYRERWQRVGKKQRLARVAVAEK